MGLAVRLLCGFFGLIFVFLGVRWMFAPEAIAAENGLELSGTLALNTARGDLGGLFIAGAILTAVGLIRRQGEWLRALAIVVACIAVGRVVGMGVDGFAATSLLPFGIEIAMIAALLGCARGFDREGSATGD